MLKCINFLFTKISYFNGLYRLFAGAIFPSCLYYGFENGITGKELYFQGIRQAQNIGIDVKNEEVIKIEMIEKSFKVKTTKNEYISKTIIIAMGTKKKTLQIDGVKKFEGRGISYCAICDGFFYRNKDVAVIGNGDYAISEVNDLLPVVNKITILTNGKTVPDESPQGCGRSKGDPALRGLLGRLPTGRGRKHGLQHGPGQRGFRARLQEFHQVH